jgi:hypothetical protein
LQINRDLSEGFTPDIFAWAARSVLGLISVAVHPNAREAHPGSRRNELLDYANSTRSCKLRTMELPNLLGYFSSVIPSAAPSSAQPTPLSVQAGSRPAAQTPAGSALLR